MGNFCIFCLLTTITLSSLIHGRPHLSERVEIRESQVESSTGTFIQVLSWYFLIFIFNFLVREIPEIQNTATQTILITSCPGGRDLIGGVCRKSEKRIHSFQWNNKGKINEVNDLQHLYFNKMLWHYLKFTIVWISFTVVLSSSPLTQYCSALFYEWFIAKHMQNKLSLEWQSEKFLRIQA